MNKPLDCTMFAHNPLKQSDRILFWLFVLEVATVMAVYFFLSTLRQVIELLFLIVFMTVITWVIMRNSKNSRLLFQDFCSKNGFDFSASAPIDGIAFPTGALFEYHWDNVISGKHFGQQFSLGVVTAISQKTIDGKRAIHYFGLLTIGAPRPTTSFDVVKIGRYASLAFGSDAEAQVVNDRICIIARNGINRTPQGIQKIFDFIAHVPLSISK